MPGLRQSARDKYLKRDTYKRQDLKRKWDKHCKYGADDVDDDVLFGGSFSLDFASTKKGNDNYIRLIDEGVVVDSGNYIYGVIAKGALKKWYDGLSANFVGHIDYAHLKALRLGTFTKADLKLVELEDDRYALDVNVKLDENLYLTKDVIYSDIAHAVSIEFRASISKWTDSVKVTGEGKADDAYPVPIFDDLDIEGYAIVEAPKNANSYNEDVLKNNTYSATNERIAYMDPDEVNTTVDETVENTAPVEEAPVEAPETEAPAEEATVEASAIEEGNAPAEEVPAEADATEGEAKTEAPAEEAPAEGEANVEASVQKVAEKLDALQAELKAKDEKIAELEAKLSAKAQNDNSLAAKLEGLLNFAATEEPTEAEGAATTTENEAKDAYLSALEENFKAL